MIGECMIELSEKGATSIFHSGARYPEHSRLLPFRSGLLQALNRSLRKTRLGTDSFSQQISRNPRGENV